MKGRENRTIYRINARVLRECCNRAQVDSIRGCGYAVRAVGPLSPFLFKKDVLAAAARDDSLSTEWRRLLCSFASDSMPLSQGYGRCNILVAIRSSISSYCFNSGFVLPLVWEKGRPNSPKLCKNLRELADRVLRELGIREEWGIRLADQAGGEQVDISGLKIECESAWTALAGALIVASRGGKNSSEIFATAGWQPGSGLKPVRYLDEKIAALIRHGGKVLFVAESDEERAKEIFRSLGLNERNVFAMPENEPKLNKAIENYTKRLEVPPPLTASFEERCRYYNNNPQTGEELRSYYIRSLLPTIAERLRKMLEKRYPVLLKQRALIVAVSFSPELAMLLLHTFRPAKALLLCSAGEKGTKQLAKQILRNKPKGCKIVRTEADFDSFEEIWERTESFAKREKPIVDLTSGKKPVTVTFALLAQRLKLPAVYVKHDFDPIKRKTRVKTEAIIMPAPLLRGRRG